MGNISQHARELSLELNVMSVDESCFLGCRHVRRSERCGTSTRSCLADVRYIGRESFLVQYSLLFSISSLVYIYDHALSSSTRSATPELQPTHVAPTLLRKGVRSPAHPTRLDVWNFAASTSRRERAHWRAQSRRSTFEIYQKSGEERRDRLLTS